MQCVGCRCSVRYVLRATSIQYVEAPFAEGMLQLCVGLCQMFFLSQQQYACEHGATASSGSNCLASCRPLAAMVLLLKNYRVP